MSRVTVGPPTRILLRWEKLLNTLFPHWFSPNHGSFSRTRVLIRRPKVSQWSQSKEKGVHPNRQCGARAHAYNMVLALGCRRLVLNVIDDFCTTFYLSVPLLIYATIIQRA